MNPMGDGRLPNPRWVEPGDGGSGSSWNGETSRRCQDGSRAISRILRGPGPTPNAAWAAFRRETVARGEAPGSFGPANHRGGQPSPWGAGAERTTLSFVPRACERQASARRKCPARTDGIGGEPGRPTIVSRASAGRSRRNGIRPPIEPKRRQRCGGPSGGLCSGETSDAWWAHRASWKAPSSDWIGASNQARLVRRGESSTEGWRRPEVTSRADASTHSGAADGRQAFTSVL